MNKKAEEYLWFKSSVARKLMADKEFYEKSIERESGLKTAVKNDFVRGVEAGVAIGFKFAARDIKTTLRLLLEEVQS